MNKEEAKNAIGESLATVLGTEVDGWEENTNLIDEGYLDSLDSMRFLFELDKKVGKKVVEDHEVELESFQVSFLLNRISGE
ncbi:MAG: acyl carrier protein [Verrucomicrobiales bacterium]|nr:acyl carrier protein [Verrucomicrobiales bacterium]